MKRDKERQFRMTVICVAFLIWRDLEQSRRMQPSCRAQHQVSFSALLYYSWSPRRQLISNSIRTWKVCVCREKKYAMHQPTLLPEQVIMPQKRSQ